MSEYLDRTIAAYDQDPDKYEASTAGMTPPVEFRRFVETIGGAGKTVLDAGCAFGRDTAEFKASGLIPVGIDLSDELLRKAVTSHPDIRFQKMDVRKLSFDDHSFDGIWCHAVLLHLKDDGIITALREFHRVLKPGGILFISFKKGEGAREVVEDFSSNSARFFNYKTTEAVMEMLQRTGFTDIDAYYINERDLFGPDKRDLDWVHCFSKNASQQSPA